MSVRWKPCPWMKPDFCLKHSFQLWAVGSQGADSHQFWVGVAACPGHVWERGQQPFSLRSWSLFKPAPLLPGSMEDLVLRVRACPLTVLGLLFQKPSTGVLGNIWNSWRPLWGLFQKPLETCISTHHQVSQMWPLAPSQKRPQSQDPAVWSVCVTALGTSPPAS